MNKKYKIDLVASLIIIIGLGLAFCIVSSTLPTETAILWKHYFPEVDKSQYLKSCSDKAADLEKKGKYFEAIKVLRNGLDNLNSRKDVTIKAFIVS